MEVDELNVSGSDAVDAHASEEDLLFAEDGTDAAAAAEYTTGEVDQLLGDDDEAEKYYEGVEAAEGAEVAEGEETHEGEEGHHDEEEEGHEDGEGEEEEEEGSGYGYRGRGGLRRPFMRGMRGGRFMMRGMMMMGPPRFFPPMHLPPGMRPPPFPFMGPGRPPFAMRGMRPMRLPMPLPPHFMRMPGVFHRYGGPTATRGRGGANEGRPAVTSSGGDSTSATTKSDGPKPLMSIPTPEPVKAMLQAQQRGRGIMGMGMGQRYHAMRGSGQTTTSRGAPPTRGPLKRPAPSNGSQPMHVDEPKSKVSNTSRSSNLKFIRTVDEPMHTAPSTTSSSYYNQTQYQYPKPTHTRGGYSNTSSSSSHYPTITASHYTSAPYAPSSQASSSYAPRQTYSAPAPAKPMFVVSHKPAPNLTQIPLTPSDASTGPASHIRPVPAVRGVKVMIWNLPLSANFAEVSAMTTSCGSVRTLNVRKENSTAIIEFSNPQSADHFIRLHNNTVMSGCVLTVNRI